MISLGQKINRERKRLKLSLEKLADKTNSSKSYIWELENNPDAKPSAYKLAKIARVCGCTIEFLLDEKRLYPNEYGCSAQALFNKIMNLSSAKKKQVEKFLAAIED